MRNVVGQENIFILKRKKKGRKKERKRIFENRRW